MQRRSVAAVLFTILTIAGCGSSDSPDSSGPRGTETGTSATLRAASVPPPSTSVNPPPSASTSLAIRSFSVTLPEGWLGIDLAPAGLKELSAKLQSSWPAVSAGLDAVVAGGSSPFHPNTTYLAYDLRAADLDQYPTGFNVVEKPGVDLSCSALDLKAQYDSDGMRDVRLDFLDLPVGRVARVEGRLTGGPQDLLGETYIVASGGRQYEPYFETRWDLRTLFDPVFEGIVGSLRVTQPLPAPSGSVIPSVQYPHDAPAFEAKMPQAALGRPLCTWSVHGAAIWAVIGPDEQALEEGILTDLDLTEGALTLAVAGRANHDDPAAIVTAYEYAGAKPESLARQFGGWQGETRRVGTKTVYVIQGADSPGHAEGLDYFYPTGEVIYHVKTADERWFEDVLRQLP